MNQGELLAPGVLSVLTATITPDGESYAYSHMAELSVLYRVDGWM